MAKRALTKNERQVAAIIEGTLNAQILTNLTVAAIFEAAAENAEQSRYRATTE
jgi:hypothetical protein